MIIFDGPSMILWLALLILWLALLIRSIAKPRRSSVALRWTAAGMLLMSANMLARGIATERKWPQSQLDIISVVKLVSSVVTLGCILIGGWFLIRSGQWSRQRPNSAPGGHNRQA